MKIFFFSNEQFFFRIILDKMCVVKREGGNDQTKSYCPRLVIDESSQVECVFANDKWVQFILV